MKAILSMAVALCLWGTAHAKTYYFSTSSGNDSRSAAQAQNPATPWKSLTKLNAIFASLNPGDVVLLKRGDTFYGTLTPNQSGTAAAPITIGAYGSGAKPLISGFTTLTGWVAVGGGKYESHNSALGSTVTMVSFNGAPQAMGRYPNASAANGGYLTFEAHGSASIKDNELPASPSWKGAELVVRTKRYVLDRTPITAHSGTKLSYGEALTYEPTDGFGYFIQGDIRTLDQLGEWFYNPKTKKMTLYFGSASPSSYSVKASTLAKLLYVYNEDNLVFDNLAFTGAADKAIDLYSADNIVVKNSDISLSGAEAVVLANGKNIKVEANTIKHTNAMAVNMRSCTYTLVRNNTIQNTGMLTGMGQNGAGRSTAIKELGEHNTIEGNTIENTGYIGINFKGDYVTVKNNVINGFNLVKDDGGGIYTQNASASDKRTGQKLIGNIVVNGIGAAFGTTSTVAASTTGIYLDDHAYGCCFRTTPWPAAPKQACTFTMPPISPCAVIPCMTTKPR